MSDLNPLPSKTATSSLRWASWRSLEQGFQGWAGFYVGLGFVFLLLIAFYGPTDNWIWDPSYYYEQLRSPLIDRDLRLQGEVLPLDRIRLTEKGLQAVPWPIGPGVVWSPFFLAAHLFMQATQPEQANGSTPIYIGLVSAGSALYGLFGVWLIYRLCRKYAGQFVCVLAALLTLLASPLFFYIFRQPIMAHSSSLLASAALLYACVLLERGELPLSHSGWVLGSLTGLNALLRWSSILMSLIPLGILGLMWLESGKAQDRAQQKAVVLQGLLFGATALLVLSPQFVAWHELHGHWLVFPSIGFNRQNLPQNFTKILFFSNRGLFPWLPFVPLGFLGLLGLPERKLRISLLVYLVCFLVLLSLWSDWYGGGGFGTRYFIEELPIAAIGFVILFQRVAQSPAGKILLGLIAAALIAHQFTLLLTVEQMAATNWINLRAYLDGQDLEPGFQSQAFLEIGRNPSWLIQPRPYVGQERQSLLVNAIEGTLNFKTGFVEWVGLLFIPAGLIGAKLLGKGLHAHWRMILPAGMILYTLTCALYLLFSG